MNNSKKMTEIIEKKKELSQEKTPKYGTRKLSIGLVSCMLGFSLIIAPGSSKAAEASENETVATDTNTPKENPIEEATPVSNEEIKTEEAKEEVVAKQADTFVEKLETIEVEEGEEIDYKEAVTNLPQDAKLDVITPIDTKEAGEKTTSAKITFADGSVKEIQIKVNVKAVEAKEEAEDLELSENVDIQPVKAPENPKTGVRDAAPPEDTTTDADANNAVHAYVGVVNGLNIDANLSKASEQQFKPIAGVKAYFQWFETDGKKEYSSPVYTATSGADGQIHMGIKPYLAEDGKLIKFDADPTVSGGNERYRFWIDESTIPEGYQLQYITGESVIFPGAGLPITQGGSGSNTVRNIHGNWKILLMEKPLDQMHKEATPTEIQQDGGYLTGTVGWDYKSGVGGIQWNQVADIDTPAKGVTVKASYLSDYALKEIYSDSTAVMMGVKKPSDIRGNGWTAEQEKKLQDWIKEQVKKDPDKWIAETVSAKTNADGKYIIQFKGTWGNLKNKDAGLKNYNYKEGDASSGQIWNRWTKEQIDRLGKVADKADNGRFDFSNTPTNQVKHVNYDWLFVSIEGSENLRVMTPYNNNQYTQMSNVFGINSGWSGTGFCVGVTNAVPQILRADFAVAPAEVKFNITNYDSGKNTAKVGDVAKTSTEGLPYYGESSENFRIVWYDEDGNKVQESKASKPSSTGSLESADFDTSKVTKTTNYTAKLYRVDSSGKNAELLAQDSFTVVVEDTKKITSMYDEFEYKNPNPLKDATYSAKGLPEGLEIDPATGDIKGVPKESGKFQVEVTTVVPDESGDITASRFYTFTVTDSPLKDGNVGKEYNTKVEPKQIDGYVFKNVTAKFIDGKAIGDLTITGDQITGKPTAKVEATQDDPNVEVTYDIYKLNEKGEEILIKKGHVDRVPLSITEEAKDTTKPEIGDLDDDDDPKTPVAPKEDENNKGPQVWANGARVTEGKEITPIKVNVTDDTDKKPTVEVTGLPKGLSYNKETGKIEGTPDKLTNWADTEEERDFTVTIKAKDAAGNESTKEIQITILRDTDGDGIPDSTDPDDDNDGIKDEEDKNPKAWDANVNGKVETTVGTQPTVDQYKEKITNLPKGSEVKVKTEPDVSKAGETKAVVTVTLPNGEEVDVKVPVTVTDTTPAKPDAPTLKANDDGSVTVTPPADKDVDVVQITYTDEKNHQGTLVATKGDDGVWKLPDGTDPSIKIDPTTGVVTIPANQVKDGSEVKAIAQKGTEVSEVAKVNAKNNPVTKKEITKWVQETADGKIIELKKEDGNKSDNDGVSDIPGYEFVRTDKTEDDTTITYTNVYKLLLGSKAVGLDGKELKAATIGYVKENPEEFTGYTFLFDEAGNTPSDVEGKKVYVVNRIYAKNPEVVEVANPDSLTADEQNKVKEAVKAANPDLLDNQISVNEKGEVTITRGNQTAKLDPTLTVVKQGQTTAPKITQPKAGDKKITGTAEPGAKVEVELPDGTKVETTADGEGNWTAEVPKGKEPKEGETVKAVATVDGKTPSDEATATTGKADPTEATAKPEITAPKAGDTEIKGKAEPNAKVEVELPDGTKVETTADGEGNWTAKVPEGKEPKEGETVKATATVDGKNPSDEATATVGKADDKGTKVGGDVKPVKPTDDKQDTGIKVENPDDDTKVTAKDEDGKDVPVEIDENGNVIVTPGTNVDGPITVTIEDPDLPGGKVEIEVPVEGHEKGRDDNNSDKDDNKTIADKTDPTVPSKTEVKDKNNLTDEEKDKVKKAIEDANKDKFPQGTKVEIGKDGTATITYPDGSVDIIKGNDLVSQKANAGASGSINRVNSSNTGKNVKTGVGSSATILATLAAAVSGLFASKKRKND